ncbi:MAG: lysophospholipid acyltransferase family protein [Pseudomonadota bacterium]
MPNRQVAREISYANSAKGRAGRTMIRVLENASGRLGLIRKAKGYDAEVAAGADFWRVITERYGVTLEVTGGSLSDIPSDGPLILVANHPYGILDGLMMGRILSDRRGGDFRVLAHKVFRKAEDLERIILPISFDETKEAAKLNLETRKKALAYLKDGGALGIFPGGTVSTAATPFGKPLDPVWRTFTAKMVAKSGATVVPIYFEGANSRLFQIASHLNYNLRMSLLIREFKTKINAPVPVVIGKPIPQGEIAARQNDPNGMMDFLRQATYALAQDPVDTTRLGFEFEDKHKGRSNGSGHIR